ncbi:biotin/lipoyl-containing protein [Amycolatopsis alkalitolerans]|uniref:Acetyl-CoA carboxylase biotin carboxyl carrier protein subunit n=1 Tax=Amycolatopsis alkalitolerans TaxID=2547244 RepID=A0A5C4M1D2_9PSEU|nr:biotin/lipoyl-containing protein [Amycolatopsis alkalitolerans]TNC25158.1 acetyl-CoA carboxylase biotin carboxyl carrier protein subunit [Amycolatopsis alkalitolerans]
MPIHIKADMAASVWKVLVEPGDQVAENQQLVILESMKMEIPVVSFSAGVVITVVASEGSSVLEGDVLVTLSDDGETG